MTEAMRKARRKGKQEGLADVAGSSVAGKNRKLHRYLVQAVI